MRLPPDAGFPTRRSWGRWAALISVAIHVVLMLVVRIHGWLPPRPVSNEILTALPRETFRAVDMPYFAGREGPLTPRQSGTRAILPPVLATPPRATVVATERQANPLALPDSVPGVGIEAPTAVLGTLRPARGEGKLWVPPLPLAPQELAGRLTQSHVELVDSVVTAVVQAYIDSVVAAPTRPGAVLPDWTTRIGGAKVGLDSKFIYLGPIKIPTMILALLNLPAQQVDVRQLHRFQDMRADLEYAARRAETLADFKAAIKQLREERQRQREFEKNSRVNPSDSTAKRP